VAQPAHWHTGITLAVSGKPVGAIWVFGEYILHKFWGKIGQLRIIFKQDAVYV
jgi:hypothetical protein